MADSFDKLQKKLFAELEKRKAEKGNKAGVDDSVQRFSSFVDASLLNMGKSRQDLARALDIERELIDAVMDGLLPESEISDDLILEIATFIKYEANILRLMLGRKINPTTQEDSSTGNQNNKDKAEAKKPRSKGQS